jgi:hypothetical protein
LLHGLSYFFNHLGKYYVVDAGYPNMVGFLSPYKETRYHIPDFQRGGRAVGKEEMYNHVHSSLRNVIERSFGVLKARFPILRAMPSFSLQSQMFIVVACMTIHNFIRLSMSNDRFFRLYEDENHTEDEDEATATHDDVRGVDNREICIMHQEREKIANMIWNDR